MRAVHHERVRLAARPAGRRCALLAIAMVVGLVIGAVSADSVAAQATVTVSGEVQWLDLDARPQPAQQLDVEVRLAPASPGDTTTVFDAVTDASGRWFVVIPSDRAIEVTYFATGASVSVLEPQSGVAALPHSSTIQVSAADASETITTIVDNDDGFGSAVSIHQALRLSGEYLNDPDLATIVALYPPPNPESITSYFPDEDRIVVTADDAYDWDVVTHEMGHAVAVRGSFSTSSPGEAFDNRTLGDNLSETLGVSDGQRLAWAEGWATFFSIWSQQRAGGASLGITGVGDSSYTDRDADGSVPVDLDLNSDVQAERFINAADNEVTVARALWLLFNAVPNRDPQMTAALRTQQPKSLADAAAALSSAVVGDQVACAFADAGYLPELTSPRAGAALGSGIPSFTWRSGGVAPTNPPSEFIIRFTTNAGAPLLEVSQAPIADDVNATNTFTPTAEQWNTIRTFGLARWSVGFAGSGSGCSQPFSVTPPLDISTSTACLFRRGVIRVAMTSAIDIPQTVTIVASTGSHRMRDRTVTVAPGQTVSTAFTGRPDGSWRIEVRDANDARVYNQLELIDCVVPSQEVEIRDWCFAGNGRIDVTLFNASPVTADYTVQIDGVSPRFALVNPGETKMVSVTGRADGSRLVRVFTTGDELVSEARVSVACDVRSFGETVVPNVVCGPTGGRLDVYAFNNTGAAVTFDIALANTTLEPRFLVVEPWSSDVTTWTGRPNTDIELRVRSDGDVIFARTVSVGC